MSRLFSIALGWRLMRRSDRGRAPSVHRSSFFFFSFSGVVLFFVADKTKKKVGCLLCLLACLFACLLACLLACFGRREGVRVRKKKKCCWQEKAKVFCCCCLLPQHFHLPFLAVTVPLFHTFSVKLESKLPAHAIQHNSTQSNTTQTRS